MEYTINDGVTQSLLCSFIHCRQMCQNILDGWEFESPKRALQFGKLVHGLLENHYTQEEVDGEAYFRDWQKKCIADGDDVQAVEKDIAIAKALVDNYVPYWQKQDSKRTWIELEGVFDVPWNGFRLRGRTDGIYRTGTGGIWLFETKTASQIQDEQMEQRLSFDFQNLFYLTAKAQELGCRIRGVMYNVIRKPLLRQKKQESDADYWQRCADDVASRPDHYYHRFEVVYTKAKQEWFQGELLAKLNDFKTWLQGGAPTYRNQNACVGRWACNYLKMCAEGTDGYSKSKELFGELKD